MVKSQSYIMFGWFQSVELAGFESLLLKEALDAQSLYIIIYL